jgi:ribonuclease Z
VDDLDLYGYSVAGEESVIGMPQLDVCFDIGKAPDQFIPIQHVLLTHGHMDHAAGIAYYLSRRNFLKMTPGVVLTPPNTVEPLTQILNAWGRLDGSRIPAKIVPMRAGEEYTIKPNHIVRAFQTRHTRDSIGFTFIEQRRKLRSEYREKTGQELVELKKQGITIDVPLEIPIATYLGDTSYVDYSQLDYVANSRILITECTFFQDEHVDRADAGRHIHIEEFVPLLERMHNEHIIITHLTQRTTVGMARAMLKKRMPAELFKRVKILMDRKYRQVPQNNGNPPEQVKP